jgi:hypothetical protein
VVAPSKTSISNPSNSTHDSRILNFSLQRKLRALSQLQLNSTLLWIAAIDMGQRLGEGSRMAISTQI